MGSESDELVTGVALHEGGDELGVRRGWGRCERSGLEFETGQFESLIEQVPRGLELEVVLAGAQHLTERDGPLDRGVIDGAPGGAAHRLGPAVGVQQRPPAHGTGRPGHFLGGGFPVAALGADLRDTRQDGIRGRLPPVHGFSGLRDVQQSVGEMPAETCETRLYFNLERLVYKIQVTEV
jgi:hypothetical protein